MGVNDNFSRENEKKIYVIYLILAYHLFTPYKCIQRVGEKFFNMTQPYGAGESDHVVTCSCSHSTHCTFAK